MSGDTNIVVCSLPIVIGVLVIVVFSATKGYLSRRVQALGRDVLAVMDAREYHPAPGEGAGGTLGLDHP